MDISKRICVLAAILAYTAHASGILVPPGLSAGSTYRLIFITDGVTSSSDANIADYNTFVSNEATLDPGLAALHTTWTALISTNDTNVLDNTGLSASDSTTLFYNMQGTLIATGVVNDVTGLYTNGGASTHSAAIYDSSGDSPSQVLAWTGTRADSTTSFFAAGNDVVLAGDSTTGSGAWTASDANAQFNQNSLRNNLFGIYAVSGVLTVTTPEPSTLATGALAGVVLILLVGGSRRRPALQ